jgi:cytoskeletal protein RodZ
MKASVISLAAALPMLVVFTAGAQQLKQPSTAPSQNAGSTLPQPASTQPRAGVSSDPAQRGQSPTISSKGPAVDADRPTPATQPSTPAASPRVTDAQGKMISGAVPMGTNQVMDPKTGKVYTTMPQGDGQRVIEPKRNP